MIKFIYHIFKDFLKRIKRKIILFFELLVSEKKIIINPKQYGESILPIKGVSTERAYISKIYNLVEESWIEFVYPIMEVRKYTNVKVYYGSDFIVTKNGAIWDKFFKPQWTKIIPLDKALLKIKDQVVFIKKPRHKETVDCGFSMCGVHSAFWAHFLVQYLPKLFFLKEIQSVVSQRITVILPPYKDEQIREIVCSYLKQLKNINIIELKKNSIADCKILYHLENTSHISDHSNFFNPSDVIIPRITLDLLKKSFVDQYLASNTLNNSLKSTPFRKLYIGRTGNRNIINKEEVENYFSKLGYDLVYPHKLSLEEKVKTFREADVIAGVLSSGFTNIMFCRPGTKILAFTNFQRTFDCYISTISKYYALDLMVITGTDTDDSIHSSFRIHLDKIKSAYSEFVLKEIR